MKYLNFEILTRLGVLLWCGVFAGAFPAVTVAADAMAPFDCGQGICGFNVIAHDLIIDPCKDRSVLVAYSQSSGATLIQCSLPDNESENLSYLFDRHSLDNPAFELAGARFIKPEFIAEAVDGGIPDRFGPVPLCMLLKSTATATSELLLVVKTVRQGDEGAYCYRLLHIGADASGLTIHADGGLAPIPSARVHAKWDALVVRLLPFVQR